MFYKYRALRYFSKQTIAKYYGVKINQLLEQHYKCYFIKFIVNKFVGNYR